MKIFITGIAGMIGYHAALCMQKKEHTVWGIDNFNNYYDIDLKYNRTDTLEYNNITVYQADLLTANYELYIGNLEPDLIIHLAAYANPRHSMEFPQLYIDNNISGTQKLIDACKKYRVNNVIYASSSCVMYGLPVPWNETTPLLHQNNAYGWSKQVNECQFLSAGIQHTAGMRFFTVYGPYGRPDMGLALFTDGIANGKPITVYNNGDLQRDFTYVEDICQGIELVANKMIVDRHSWNEIYNIGYGEPVQLIDFIQEIEINLGKKAIIDFKPLHPADAVKTWADTTKIQELGYRPKTSVKDGVKKFVDWWTDYYKTP
jgi:UDP-glucuronate 4-epimerase